MRPGALASLQRGAVNLRANRELVALIWAQRGLLVLLSLASILPFRLLLDLRLPGDGATPDEYLRWMAGLGERLAAQIGSLPFWLAVLASSAVLMLAIVIYSFLQAGAVAVLARGEHRARVLGDEQVASFRSYSWRSFQAAAGHHLWPFFWLFNLILVLWTVWLLFIGLTGLMAALATGGAGLAAGLTAGCAGLLPLLFIAFVLLFWSWLAQIEMVSHDCGAWRGLLQGLRLTVRGLGRVLMLSLCLAIAVGSTTLIFVLLTLSADAGLRGVGAVRGAVLWMIQAAQWLVGGVVDTVFVAALLPLATDGRQVGAPVLEASR